MNSVAKNNPPRKPEPSETIEATALSANTPAMKASGIATMPAKRSAPWPDDITCGVSSAIAPTASPPSAGRSGCHSRVLASSASHSVTPRMIAIPVKAAAMPSSAAIARSRPSTSPTVPTPTPSGSGSKAWATK